MEVVQEPPLLNDVTDCGKSITMDEVDLNNTNTTTEADVCPKSNGDAEFKHEEMPSSADISLNKNEETTSEVKTPVVTIETDTDADVVSENTNEQMFVQTEENKVTEEPAKEENNIKDKPEIVVEESMVEVDGIVDTVEESVTFETEILVESDVGDIEEHIKKANEDTASAIFDDLGKNLDLSEVLRSSDTNNIENNNCEQEVFNKEELLDILEGNDEEQVESRKILSKKFPEDSKKLEEQLALQQLSRLQSKKSKNKKTQPEKKTPKKRSAKNEEIKSQKTDDKKEDVAEVESKAEDNGLHEDTASQGNTKDKEESIVSELVKDWDDEDRSENDDSKKIQQTTEINKSLENDTTQSDAEKSQNESMDDSTLLNSSKSEEAQPQRRFTRVIKKKVIFDPDNPDTFTKTKTIKKEPGSEKEQPSPPKKSKCDPTSLRAKSKSPINKMQWKKPTPKNSKQTHKRPSEIDKLLMDEGAVNMICQLTPEAPKGKKNMKSKAEFIKKIQSNTPNTKEMKFRERKKEKVGDGEPRKISGKDRLSLSSSVKSPSMSEDFEAHSADDSIIYRRHSSSSYSSSCMSPRRLSDVEINPKETTVNVAQRTSDVQTTQIHTEVIPNNTSEISEVFLEEKTNPPLKPLMNKRDCLSIKEKLNSKLSQVLNKRKRESIAEKPEKKVKTEKPAKSKKPSTVVEIAVVNISQLVKINYNNNVAEICIGEAGSMYSLQMLQELNNVLVHVDSQSNISLTLIISEAETTCSSLDLSSLLKDEQRVENATEISEAVKCLQNTLWQHSKLTCLCVQGRCDGFSLALAALSDVVIASEDATFSLLDENKVLLQPGPAALRETCLPKSVLNDLIIFGKRLSASEALSCGLVSRVIWPERFLDQVRAIANDIGVQPALNLMLKKQLLPTKKSSDATFMSSLEKEQELLVKYWTSTEGLANLSSIFSISV